MGYTMKHTNGKKSDTSSFPFKIDAPSATSDSPAKLANSVGNFERGGAIGLAAGGIRGFKAGGVLGGLAGATTGVLGLTTGDDAETLAAEEQYSDTLASEGLNKNFWGKIGFKGGKYNERASRVKELQEQDQMGIDRERIESRGGVTAGPA